MVRIGPAQLSGCLTAQQQELIECGSRRRSAENMPESQSEKVLSLHLCSLSVEDAEQVLSRRYPPPYDIYDAAPGSHEETVRFLSDPTSGYFGIRNAQDALEAFCCLGLDAQVPGGDYSDDALDAGLGLRPDLTGHGRGSTYVEALLQFAVRQFSPRAVRVTVAQFNLRALRVWRRAGFTEQDTFRRESDGMPFVVLVMNLPVQAPSRADSA